MALSSLGASAGRSEGADATEEGAAGAGAAGAAAGDVGAAGAGAEDAWDGVAGAEEGDASLWSPADAAAGAKQQPPKIPKARVTAKPPRRSGSRCPDRFLATAFVMGTDFSLASFRP
jgi:hypothetical protein